MACCKGNRTGCVEWFGFHCVMNGDSRTHTIRECLEERFGFEANCKNDFSDSGSTETGNEMFELANVGNRQQWLWRGQGQRSQPSSETPDKNDRVHQPPVVVVAAATVVVVAPLTVVVVAPFTVVVVAVPASTAPSSSRFSADFG